jgi:prevent-host-death family protein
MDHSLVHNNTVEISVTDAKAQLTELVRRAEAGDEIILTRHGHPAAKLVPVKPKRDWDQIVARVEEIQRQVAAKATPGPEAARSQDFLYDEYGLPK